MSTTKIKTKEELMEEFKIYFELIGFTKFRALETSRNLKLSESFKNLILTLTNYSISSTSISTSSSSSTSSIIKINENNPIKNDKLITLLLLINKDYYLNNFNNKKQLNVVESESELELELKEKLIYLIKSVLIEERLKTSEQVSG